jgi:DNA repair protein RadD
MIKVQYHSKLLSDPNISEYFPITHDGFAGQKARRMLAEIASNAGVKTFELHDIEEICQVMNGGIRPNEISYKKEGKFYKVTDRKW